MQFRYSTTFNDEISLKIITRRKSNGRVQFLASTLNLHLKHLAERDRTLLYRLLLNERQNDTDYTRLDRRTSRNIINGRF